MAQAKAKTTATFSDVGDTYRNCHLDWWGSDTPTAICKGFKEVGDLAVVASLENPHHPDIYFRPVAFLYRHYLEVQLKRIVQLADKLLHTKDRKQALATHDLLKLWTEARKVLERVWPDADDSQLKKPSQVS